ncbi:sensor histidine kinase [Halanaeroarchaeum sulfurireducens]|uniref:histidine kinase n=1 Tax=Halanaeroarchaeum sulfurireducens TaxID=1604004 RepID=A0A0F7PDC8_9EURY|nr:ATP-binding protein [Halanaeroarchaeum sulfurireducens]AKH97639.1 histidine kinase [Halanaeroarchaeum sulfurireducens]ALG82034.1 histidine kinase [Halanaeroarchaeum sulfurireducens]
MNAIFLSHILIFTTSAIVCLASIPRARTIQHPGSRRGFVVFLSSVALWSGGYVGYLLAPTEWGKLGFYILGFVFAFVAVGAFLYFSAAYTGRPPGQMPYQNAAIGVFFLIILLKATNPLHTLYFTSEWTSEPFPHLAIHHEMLYWVVLGLSYALIAVGFFMLIERFYHTGTDSRPLVVLLALTGLPAGATILGDQIPGLLPLMYEPPGVALFAVGTLFVYKQRFEAIRLTGESEEPAIFLDTDGRIRDYNQRARTIFPALEGSIGKTVESVSSSLADTLAERGVITVSDGDTRYYEISTTPFAVGDVPTGRLVTITDVTDRETYRRQLEAKTEQLEALNRVVRHDIRNDMAVILGWAETLTDHVDEEGRDALDKVLKKSRHVIELTRVARDFVESLSQEEALELDSVDLAQRIETELEAVRDSSEDAHLRVEGDLPRVSVQANEMLSSVFRNLLENAVRHNDEDTPEITVSCEEGPESVRVRIADNGPGIPDERKEKIFGKGEKGLDSPGTGIGLYLVHTLVDRYDGDVWVEDNEPKGSIFVVELPKSEPDDERT